MDGSTTPSGMDAAIGPDDAGMDAAPEAEDAATDAMADAMTDAASPHTLSSIEVAPRNPLVELDLAQTGEQAFTAMGHYLDGTSDDVTGQVQWLVANSSVGAFTGATLSIPAFNATQAEVSLITAQLSGVDGVAQITVVAHASSGPEREPLLVLPYQDPGGATHAALDFDTAIPSLDVFFLMDATGSMQGSITNLINSLTATVIPGISATVSDSQFGVGALEDFPVTPYGSLHGSDCGNGEAAEDQPFKLRQAITGNVAANQSAVNGLTTGTAPIGCGADWPEAGLEAIYQVATGEGLSGPSPTSVPANHTGIGGVGFRAGAMPVVVTISDASSHGVGEPGTCSTTADADAYAGTVAAVAHSRAQVKDALAAICARSVGVAAIQSAMAASCRPVAYMADLSTSTGARVPPAAWDAGTRPAGCATTQCCTGVNGAGVAPDAEGLCPLVFQVTSAGTGLGTAIVTGIEKLTAFARFDATAEPQGGTTDLDGNTLPDAHTTMDFVQALAPTGFILPPGLPTVPDPTFDASGFFGVLPGTSLSFDLQALNDFVPQTADAQLFRVTLLVVGGACSTLDAHDVLVLVPPIDVP